MLASADEVSASDELESPSDVMATVNGSRIFWTFWDTGRSGAKPYAVDNRKALSKAMDRARDRIIFKRKDCQCLQKRNYDSNTSTKIVSDINVRSQPSDNRSFAKFMNGDRLSSY